MPAFLELRRLLPALFVGSALLAGCADESAPSLVDQAKKMAAAGDDKSAIIQLKNALAADEDDAEARFELGKLYLARLDLAAAEKEFRRAREAGYPAAAANVMIARALLGQRAFQRLLDELPAPSGKSDDALALHALRATAELGLGRKEDARKTLAQAQADAPRNAEVQLALAQLAAADGKPADAMKAVDEALQIDPAHRDSLLLKGDLLYASGKSAEATATYRDILRIAPRHPNARLALAGIALAENRLAEARKEVDGALAFTPSSLQAHYLRALIDFKEGKTERARDGLAAVLKSAPDFLPALQLGGTVEYALGNLQTAEAHFNKVVQAAPHDPYALRLLAATQLRMGRFDDAARTIGVALRRNADDPAALTVAGEIALAKRDFAQAARYFEDAASRDPGNAAIRTELGISRLGLGDERALADLRTAAGMEGAGSRAHTFLILDGLKRKQFDAALASIAALEKKEGANPLVWNYRGAAYLGKQDKVRARASFEEALKLDRGFFPAAANLAQLDLQEKRPAAARQRFESILAVDPKHLGAMLALAELALRSGDEKTHTRWLEKAAAAHPQAQEPRLALGSHLLRKGSAAQALTVAREAVNLAPDSPAALELLGSAQLALGDSANALASYRKLVERQPDKAAPLAKLAYAQWVAKDAAGARRSLQAALQREPAFREAQLLLGRIEIEAERFEAAYRIARRMQAQKPEQAAGFVLEGDTAFAQKDFPAALAAFERAHAIAPSGATLARQHRVLSALQRAPEGEKRILSWLSSHADDAPARLLLAESLIKRREYAAAARHYLVLHEKTPDDLVVLNNLAWALHESKDTRALGYAAQALKLRPEDPAILDTYGWILARQGQPAQGLTHLRKALSKAPDAAEIRYHVAAILYQTGEHDRARGELERLLADATRFPQEQEARDLLARLRNKKS